MSVFDADASRAARDSGMSAAGGELYKDEYQRFFDLLRNAQPDLTDLPERFHEAMFQLGLSQPPCPQALSSNFSGAIRRGKVKWTGERRRMEKVSSHARGDCKVYKMVPLPDIGEDCP